MPTHVLDPANLYDVAKDYRNSILTKYFGVASFTILVWDHIATFPDEVELIWKGKKGLSIYLFLLNRYLIPLSFIVNLCAYFGVVSDHGSCDHFVRFEGSMTMLGVSVVAWMMFLRIRVLYAFDAHRLQLVVQALVIGILLTYIGANSYLLTRGIPVHHFLATSCTMIIDPNVPAVIASSSAWLPLLYDTVVVSLTIYRTAGTSNSESFKSTGKVLLREGLVYYSAIFTVTLVFTVMIVSADPSVRNITGQLELCLTVAIMSRITLHLKRFGKADIANASYAASNRSLPPFVAHRRSPPQRRLSETSRLGTLPTVSFTPGWLTPSPTPSDTEGEYFAMKPRSSAAAGAPLLHPTSRAETNLAGSSTSPVTIDLGGP